MEIVKGKIIDITSDGATIFAPIIDLQRALKRKYEYVEVGFPDGRNISSDQRKKAYALMAEIAAFTGDDMESNKQMLKLAFIKDNITSLYNTMFSLSNCDMTTAREFISFLIDFIIRHDIPTREPLFRLCDDIERYVYSCIIHQKCVLCGKPAELHHVEAVGMGNDRKHINHLGKKCLSLCRVHHNESHVLGRKEFLEKYHLVPLPITKEIGKIYGVKVQSLEGG